jgi:protease-4
LEIDLTRGLLSSAPTDPLAALRSRGTPTLSSVVEGVRRGARDPQVAAIVVQVGGLITVAQAEELGAALRDAGEHGTATLAWAESYGELSAGTVPYYLAAHCEEVWLQPSGGLALTGVAVAMTLLRGVLDKVGAEPQLDQRHEYKTAAEQLSAHEVSPANREMSQRLADSVVEQVRALVVRTRGITPAEFDAVLAGGPLTAQQARAVGLVDRLGYRDEAYAALTRRVLEEPERRTGTSEAAVPDLSEVRWLYASRYAAKHGRVRLRPGRPQPIVAVVDVTGGIVSGRGGPAPGRGPSAGSDAVGAVLRGIGRDDQVEAVVLHVDSPGGSYSASDAIRREVLALREGGRSVVASMGAVAASGGYFVSMAADEVVALPSTLTGSIGVLGGKVVLRELADKVGLEQEVVTAGEHAAMFSSLRRFSDQEWQRVQDWLDVVYLDFTTKAALDRGLPVDDLEPVARGRVWTGADARTHGLVDTLGGLQTAVSAASGRAGLDRESVQVRRFPRQRLADRLRPPESSQSPAAAFAARGSADVLADLVLPNGRSPQVGADLLQAVMSVLAPAATGILSMPMRVTVT